MNDAQPFEGQKLIHFADARALGSHQGGKPASGYDLGLDAIFFLNAPHDAVDQADVAVKDSGLDRVYGILANYFFGFDDFDARQFGRALDQRFQRNRQSGRDGAANVFAFLGDQVNGRSRAEVDDDATVMIFLEGGDAIDDAIGADILGTLVENRHAGFDPRADDQRLEIKKLLRQFLGRRQHRRHDTGNRNRIDLIHHETGVADQLADDDAVLVGRAFSLSRQAPVGNQLLILVEPKNYISIADIDG